MDYLLVLKTEQLSNEVIVKACFQYVGEGGEEDNNSQQAPQWPGDSNLLSTLSSAAANYS